MNRKSGFFGNGRQSVQWALNHWAYDWKDRLIGVSAYSMSLQTGFTPQTLNRILCQLWWEGKVAYRTEGRRGKRIWAWVNDAKQDREKGWCVSKAAELQMELPL